MFIVRIVAWCLRCVIGLMQFFLIARAILSWIMPMEQNRFTYIIFTVTEPIIKPMRMLLRRIPALDRVPIDLSALAAFVILSFAARILMIFTI